jgi:hypothetical protein
MPKAVAKVAVEKKAAAPAEEVAVAEGSAEVEVTA